MSGRKRGPADAAERAKLDRARKARWDAYRAEQAKTGPKICSIEGCEKPFVAKGMCGSHYARWKVTGDALHVRVWTRAEDHPSWQGDDIGYDAAHWRAKSELPSHCESCGRTDGRLEIALLRNGKSENYRTVHRSNRIMQYSVSTDDYARLCVKCHRRYDSPRPETRVAVTAALRATRNNA